MGRMRWTAVLLSLLAFAGIAGASHGGLNSGISLESTPVVSVTVDHTSYDGQPLSMVVELNGTAAANGTAVAWTTQVCTNDLICHAPVEHQMTSTDDGRNWTGEMTPPEDHTYVNYLIILKHADGSEERLPESGFGGKVWSDCWYTVDDGWGGLGCGEPVGMVEEPVVDEQRTVPAPALMVSVLAIGLAAIARRDA